VLESFASCAIVALHTLTRPPLFQDGQCIGHAASVEWTLLAAVGVHKTIHQIALLMVGTAVEGRKGFATIEIVEVVPILTNEIAARLELDAVLPCLGLGQMPHVVEAQHKLVELFERWKATGQIKKHFSLKMSRNDEVPVRQLGDLIPIGATKKIQRRKGELRDAVRKEVERWIQLVPRVEIQGCEFWICGDMHSSMILRPFALGKNLDPSSTAPLRKIAIRCHSEIS